MNYKISILLFWSFFFSSIAIGQSCLGVKINLGVSKLSEFPAFYTNNYTLSGNAGFYFDLYLTKRFYIGSEVVFNQLEGAQKSTMTFTDDNGQPIETREIERRQYISYTSLPVFVGVKLNRVSLRVGVQPSILIKGYDSIKAGSIEVNGMLVSLDSKNEIPLKNYDFGGGAGISFQLSHKFALDANLYYGLINILDVDGTRDLKGIQMTLGVKYKFKNLSGASE